MKAWLRRLKNRLYYNVYRRARRYWQPRTVFKDVHVYSYPKSGRTWLRIMLEKINDTGLSIAYVHGDAVPKKLRHYKSMTFDLDKFKDRKIIFLIRDPRDTVVSAYYDAQYRDRIYNGSISDFIRHNRFGIKKVLAFHELCFQNFDSLKHYMLVKYEDLQADTRNELVRVIDFLGGQVSEEQLEETILFARFDNMKKMEVEGQFQDEHAYRLSLVSNDEPNSSKVRKGKIGGYLQELSQEDIEYCNHIMSTMKNPFYPI
jgi:hypothetical protein